MTFDLIAVGGGFAGLTAAVRATELGLRAAVVERGAGEHYLCNSRVCTGVVHIAFLDPATDEDTLYRQIQRATGNSARDDLARTFAVNGGRTLDWLADKGAKFGDAPHRYRGPPMLMPARALRAGLDWEESAPNLLLKELRSRFEKAGGTMRCETEAISLLMEDGACTGLEVESASGRERLLSRTVVLADGGFQANRERLGRHITARPEQIRQRNVETGIGAGMRMAEEAGAALVGLDKFYGHVLSRDVMTNEMLWPYPQLDALCAASVVVDANARRFADEGHGGIALTNVIAGLDQPLGAFVVFDADAWEEAKTEDIVPPNPSLIENGGTVFEAPSIEALAEAAGLDRDTLTKTVSDYNDAVAAETLASLSPARTSDVYQANPIRRPPFRAIPICAGITVTMGGIAVDGAAQVVRPDDTPIPGLYAAGSSVGGIEGGPRAGYVGGLIKAFLLGLVAAESVAEMNSGRN